VHSRLALALVVGLHPRVLGPGAGVVELPGLRRQQLREPPHALLVALVGEVCAERAAAVIGPPGIDALAALTEDAHVARRQPGEVALEHLRLVRGIDELDVGAGNDEVGLRHAGQTTTATMV
jgi:hypothetical protein